MDYLPMSDEELHPYQGQLVKVTPTNGAAHCYVGKVQAITSEHLVLFPATAEPKNLDEKAHHRLRSMFSSDGWTGDEAFGNAFDDGSHQIPREQIGNIERLVW